MLEPYQALLQCPSCHLLLDQPSTLHCGHTVCAQHLLRTPGSSATPALACPLPDCPSRTGNRTTGLPPLNIPASSRVAYFPAAHADDLPAPDHRAPTEPRIDVAINKLLHLVARAQEWEAAEREHGAFVPGQRAHDDSDTDDDDDDSAPGITAPAAEPVLAVPPRPPSPPSPQQAQSGPRPRASSGSQSSANHRPRKRRRRAEGSQGSQDGPAASSSGAHRPTGGDEAVSARARFEKELRSEVTCEICFTLLHEPVTTPCQHTYCGKCLQRSLDHSTACPLCREDLPGYVYFQAHPVARTLLSILLHAFAPEYTERAEAIAQEERDARLDTPIFVCQLSFPGVPTLLHFFEPRYRLMLRRCLESAHPAFGMVMPPNAPAPGVAGGGGGGGGNEYGTMLEIRSVQMLPDGRSMVETWGTHRFRILERGSLDGYMVGRIERVDDYATELDEGALAAEGSTIIDGAAPLATGQSPPHTPPRREARSALSRLLSPSPEPEAPPTASGSSTGSASTSAASASTSPATPPHPGPPTTPTNEQLMATCRAFLLRLQEGTAPWVVQRLNNTYGPMPTDAASFSFWVALVLPIDEHEKAKLLPIKSARLRLRLVVHWIEQLNSNWWFSSGCVIL
ncbi:hypothetical protein FIBSPDRAFT_747336 [Athelia psychrophila]|uniref:LON-domain-containing protein n=1 Tax=Athelia psychrophila TaxID=1759441 RepID=A0A166FXP4_9AGAM|nr:hypothetical protein FIBSPDRAFT_747336 [Fibularhizoctonia sp. CBS 109695]